MGSFYHPVKLDDKLVKKTKRGQMKKTRIVSTSRGLIQNTNAVKL